MKCRFLLLLFLLPFFTTAQGTKGFQVLKTPENDFFAPANRDENYTGGLKIEVLTPGIKLFNIPFYHFKNSVAVNIQRFAVGGTAYTPQDIASSAVIVGDRPFASLLYFSLGNTSFNLKNNFILQSDIIIGSVGGKGVGSAQAYIHRHHWFGSTRPVPEGWENQIGYNGSLVINYNSRIQGPIGTLNHPSGESFKLFQANWVGGIDIGNYMLNLQGGVKLNFFNYNMTRLQEYNPDIPVTLASEKSTSAAPKKSIRANLFFEPHLWLAAYNATLEGLLFNDHSVYTIDHDRVNRLLLEMNGGVNLVLGDVVYLRYSLYSRSREFTGGKAWHSWGSVTIGVCPGRWYHE